MKTQDDKLSYTAEFERLFRTHLSKGAEPAKLPGGSVASSLPAWAATAEADPHATQIVRRDSFQPADEYARVTGSVTASGVTPVAEPSAPPAPPAVPQFPGVSPKTFALILGGAILWLHLEALLLLLVMRH